MHTQDHLQLHFTHVDVRAKISRTAKMKELDDGTSAVSHPRHTVCHRLCTNLRAQT